MITASTVEAFENCENLLAAIPKTDPLFSLNAAVSNLKKVVFKADGEVCGLLLYEVLENERGEKVFFISAFSVDAKSVHIFLTMLIREIGRHIHKVPDNTIRKAA